jgi:hypothetical protein
VVITAAGADGNLYYWWQAADTGAWNQEIVATGNLNGFPSIAWTGSSVVIAAVGGNGGLYYWWQAADTAACFDRRTRQPPTAPDGLSGGRCAELKNGGLKDVIENKGGRSFRSCPFAYSSAAAWRNPSSDTSTLSSISFA